MPKEKTKPATHVAGLALDHIASETSSTSSSSPGITQLTGRGQISISNIHTFWDEGNRFSVPGTLEEKHIDLANKVFIILHHNKKSEHYMHLFFYHYQQLGEGGHTHRGPSKNFTAS